MLRPPLDISGKKSSRWGKQLRGHDNTSEILIRHLINDKRTGAEMRRAIVSWTVSTGDAPVSYWPIFFPLPTNNRRKLRESYFCVVLSKLRP